MSLWSRRPRTPLSPLNMVEPRLVLRCLRITTGPDVTLHIDATGLDGTGSEVTYCRFANDGDPGTVTISVDLREFEAS